MMNQRIIRKFPINKAHDSHAMNAIEGKKREELESSKLTRNGEEIVRISSNSSDEKQRGENVNQNIFNRKTKGTIKKNFNDDESSGSDVRILGEEKVVMIQVWNKQLLKYQVHNNLITNKSQV